MSGLQGWRRGVSGRKKDGGKDGEKELNGGERRGGRDGEMEKCGESGEK